MIAGKGFHGYDTGAPVHFASLKDAARYLAKRDWHGPGWEVPVHWMAAPESADDREEDGEGEAEAASLLLEQLGEEQPGEEQQIRSSSHENDREEDGEDENDREAAAPLLEQPGEEQRMGSSSYETDHEAGDDDHVEVADDRAARMRQLLSEYSTHHHKTPQGKENAKAMWEALQSEGWTKQLIGNTAAFYYFPAGVTQEKGFVSRGTVYGYDGPPDLAGRPTYYNTLSTAVRHLRQTGWHGWQPGGDETAPDEAAAAAATEQESAATSQQDAEATSDGEEQILEQVTDQESSPEEEAEEGDDDHDARMRQLLAEYGAYPKNNPRAKENNKAIWEALQSEGWTRESRGANFYYFPRGVTKDNGYHCKNSLTKDGSPDPAGRPAFYNTLAGVVRHLRQIGWHGYEHEMQPADDEPTSSSMKRVRNAKVKRRWDTSRSRKKRRPRRQPQQQSRRIHPKKRSLKSKTMRVRRTSIATFSS